MAEPFFALTAADQREVLELARERTGRPAHLLEKDAWVVWTLRRLRRTRVRRSLGGARANRMPDHLDVVRLLGNRQDIFAILKDGN